MPQRLLTLSKDSLIYGLGSFAGGIVGVVLIPVYTRVFSPDEYGIIELILTTIVFLTFFLILGTETAIPRFYVDSKDYRDRIIIASTGLFFRAGFVVLIVLVIIYFSGDLSRLILHDKAHSNVFVIALATLPFSLCYRLCLNMLRYNFRPIPFAMISAGNVLLHACLAIYLVVGLRWGIAGVFGANLITSALLLGITLWVTRENFSFTFSTTRLKELLRFGVPFVPANIAIYLMLYCDRYFLINFATLEQVGLYGIGNRLASVLVLLFAGFQMAWAPFVYAGYRESDAQKVFAKVGKYFWALACFLGVTLSLFSREVLTVFTTPQYLEAYKVVPFLAASVVFFAFGGNFSFGVNLANKTIHRAWTGVVAAVTNIGLNFLLIPAYGMIGAAAATMASSMLFAILLFSLSQRYYHVGHNLASLAKLFLVAVSITLIGYYFLLDVSWQNIVIKIALMLVFAVFVYTFNLIGRAELGYIKQASAKARGVIIQSWRNLFKGSG